MGIKRFMVPGEMEPVSHYCHAVRAGRHIWLSGMVGVAADGLIPNDTAAQFNIALKTIDNCLRHAGGLPHQIIKVQVFMTGTEKNFFSFLSTKAHYCNIT